MFDDIRPYRDHEVVVIIEKLVAEKELQNSIAIYTLPYLYKLLPSLARFLVKLSLKSRVAQFKTVNDVQNEMARYLFRLIKKSTDGFTYSGLAELDLTQPTLFVSNHRDIVLDPALVNMALFDSNENTVEIAIGDNLLSKEWVSDLMRLNKSFIVKRNEKTKRAMLMASKNLSAYIHHALTDNNQHIWIAQREGRAKDGLDKTNAALISMLLLNKPKETSIGDYLKQLNIVPVSISYELDPCDKDKAIELATIEETGTYEKSEHEDIRSITQGLVGHKGQVHIAFGEVISGDFEDSKSIAAAVDEQIIKNYRLFDSNNTAYELLKDKQDVPDESHLDWRMENLNDRQRRWLLTMYANPVAAKKELNLS